MTSMAGASIPKSTPFKLTRPKCKLTKSPVIKMVKNDSAINTALFCLASYFVKMHATAMVSESPRLVDEQLLSSIYETLISKIPRKSRILTMISALVIFSPEKTEARGKASIGAKKLKDVA